MWFLLLSLAVLANARPQSLKERFPIPVLGEELRVPVASGSVRRQPQISFNRPIRPLPAPVPLPAPIPLPAPVPLPAPLPPTEAVPLPAPAPLPSPPEPQPDTLESQEGSIIFGDLSFVPQKEEEQNTNDLPRFTFVVPESPTHPPSASARRVPVRTQVPRDSLDDRHATIVAYDRLDPTEDGVSGVRYETSNGIKFVERSEPDSEGYNTVRGSYSYTSPEGTPITVYYEADRFGFRVRSDGLEMPPHAKEQYLAGQAAHAAKYAKLARGEAL